VIAVTGTSGFIGSHLIEKLIRKFGNSQVIALTSKESQLYQCINHQDYTNFSNECLSLKDARVIIHAGAFIPKNNNDANNAVLCNSNIASTFELLKHIDKNLDKFIFLSSIDVYQETEVITEFTPIGMNSLYGISKIYCEKMVLDWGKENGVDVLVCRVGHVFGPGEEKYQKLIPETIKRVLKGINIEIWGSGEDLRAFVYVDDVVDSIIAAIDKKTESNIINVVGNDSLSIKEIVEAIIEVSQKSVNINYKEYNAKGRNLRFNNDTLKKELFTPKVAFKDGLLTEWLHIKRSYENHNI
jgi:UDP-glucose 4-epimerase